jgi:hypothetical protein
MPNFYVDAGDLNSAPYICTKSILTHQANFPTPWIPFRRNLHLNILVNKFLFKKWTRKQIVLALKCTTLFIATGLAHFCMMCRWNPWPEWNLALLFFLVCSSQNNCRCACIPTSWDKERLSGLTFHLSLTEGPDILWSSHPGSAWDFRAQGGLILREAKLQCRMRPGYRRL